MSDSPANESSDLPVLFLMTFWFVLFVLLATILAGNFYVTESGFKEKFLRPDQPSIQITDIDRGIFHWTRVTVKAKDETQKTFCVGSNIFCHYELADCTRDSLGVYISDMPDPP